MAAAVELDVPALLELLKSIRYGVPRETEPIGKWPAGQVSTLPPGKPTVQARNTRFELLAKAQDPAKPTREVAHTVAQILSQFVAQILSHV